MSNKDKVATTIPGGQPSARDLDILYRETDKLYYEFARGCGLSDCAYWIIYGIVSVGGQLTQRQIAERFSYSKQTVNSALKTLEGRGLVELSFAEGSRRSKVVSLTPAGGEFARTRVVPAIEAEDRAFGRLTPSERFELVRLVGAYTAAIDQELGQIEQKGDAGGQ